jgi:D-lactate dehydrogenase (cytochrome)
MNEVIAFHPEDLDVVVGPGMGWEDLNLQLKEHGLFFPLDPGPGKKKDMLKNDWTTHRDLLYIFLGACIGGMIGTSCSGTNAVRYGTMKEWVINLTVVTADGKVVKTRQRPR